MFPGYTQGSHKIKSDLPVDDSTEDVKPNWLTNQSFCVEAAVDSFLTQARKQDDICSELVQVSDSHKAKQPLKRELTAAPEIKRARIENKKPKVFLEDFGSEIPEDLSYRDIKGDRYSSIHKPIFSVYQNCFKQCLASDLPLFFTTRSQRKSLRYFGKRKQATQALRLVTPLPYFLKSDFTKKEFIPVLYEGDHDESGEEKTTVFNKPEILLQLEQFNQALRENPRNIDMWLKFIDFQDILIPFQFVESRLTVNNNVIVDKKISIAKKALDENPRDKRIKLLYLKLNQKIMDSPDLQKEWQRILFLSPNDVDIWYEYMRYLSTWSSFNSVEIISSAFTNCIKMLRAVMAGTMLSHPRIPFCEEKLIDLYIWFCSLLYHCGYTERSIGLLQAWIEFNLFQPTTLPTNATTDKRLVFFELFWESCCPRFGEPGAKGWLTFADERILGRGEPLRYTGDEEVAHESRLFSVGDQSRHQTWLAVEKSRESRQWLPWKPNLDFSETAADCEDVDRIVSFDDISPFIFPSEKTSDSFRFVCSCLLFLDALSLETVMDLHITTACLPTFPYFFSSTQISAASHTDFDFRLKLIDNILAGCIDVFKINNNKYRGFFSALWFYVRSHFLKKKVFAEKLKTPIKEFRKEAKNRLRSEENILVWASFAEMEFSLGYFKEAEKILDRCRQNTIAFSESLMCYDDSSDSNTSLSASLSKQMYLSFLWKHSSVILNGILNDLVTLESSSSTLIGNSVSVVLSITNYATVTSATILSALHKYSSLVCRLEAELKLKFEIEPDNDVEVLVKCLCVFIDFLSHYLVLLTTQRKLKTIDDVFSGGDSFLCSLQLCLENKSERWFVVGFFHHELCVRRLLLSEVARASVIIPRRPVRSSLLSILSKYPDDKRFIDLLIRLEASSGIDRRIRKYFSEQTGNTHLPWLCVISHEIGRLDKLRSVRTKVTTSTSTTSTGEIASGLVNYIRHIYRQAVERFPDYAPLWIGFLQFESSLQTKSTELLNGLIYEALSSCPLNKELYLVSISLAPEKLKELVNQMVEKGLRIRLPLEELDLLLPNDQTADEMKTSDNGDDDISDSDIDKEYNK